jgi:hypothetical protein
LLINTVVCLTLAKWETVSGQFGGYLTSIFVTLMLKPEAGAQIIGSYTGGIIYLGVD